MKKISMGGVILGVVVGIVAAMISGTWIFWLGAGLAIGMLIGTATARRPQLHDSTHGKELRT